jgi:hypothetical protein
MIHYLLIAQDELHTLEGQKAYCEEVLAEGGLQSWQSKEYSVLIEDYIVKIAALKERIQWIIEQES